MGRRILRCIIALLIMASIIPPLNTPSGQDSLFIVKNVIFRSSAGGDVYPGSKNAELIVETLYNGTQELVSAQACLTLPKGLNPSVGSSACSIAYDPGGEPYDVIKPGSIVDFRYRLNVDRSVKPGEYNIIMNITCTDTSSRVYNETHVIKIRISPYPPLNIRVYDSYWSPAGYPGSTDINLIIVLENYGDNRVIDGEATIWFSEGVYPRKVRVSIPAIDAHDRVRVTITGIDLSPELTPDSLITIHMFITATSETDDGVRYSTSKHLTIVMAPDKPPKIRLNLIDYGLTADKWIEGIRYTKIYARLQNTNQTRIHAIAAYFRIIDGAVFINGSSISVVTLTGPYNYGDFINIISDEIIVGSSDAILVELNLTLLCDKDNAEFWANTSYKLLIPLSTGRINARVIDAYWSNGAVYPGSSDETLNIVIENPGPGDLLDCIAVLKLPKGFTPNELHVAGFNIAEGARHIISFAPIDISMNTAGGTYLAELYLDCIVRYDDGSIYNATAKYVVELRVQAPGAPPIKLIDYGWTTGRAYVSMVNTGLRLTYRVVEPVEIRSMYIKAILPPQVYSIETGNYTATHIDRVLGYGSIFDVELDKLCINASLQARIPVVIYVIIYGSRHGAEFWINYTDIIVLSVTEPRLNITLIDKGWVTGKAYGVSRGIGLYVTFQSFSVDRIITLIAEITLPNGVYRIDGSRTIISYIEEPIDYGEVFTVRAENLYMNTSAESLAFKIKLYATLAVGEARYNATMECRAVLNITKPEKTLILSHARILYNGAPSPLLPGARGATLDLTLLNTYPEPISSMQVNVSTPRGFIVRGVGGSCLAGVGGGSTCTLSIALDVENKTEPGEYSINLSIMYIKDVRGSLLIGRQRIQFKVCVDDPSNYVPELRIVDVYWGDVRPETVFKYDREAPITIVIVNRGRYSVNGVTVSISTTADGVRLIKDSDVCAATLTPGGSCRVTLYVDLGGFNESTLPLRIKLAYAYDGFGTHIIREVEFNRSLEIQPYAPESPRGVDVVDAGWSNNWPTYPGTEEAVYTVTIANTLPYPIGGIKMRLELPKGLYCSDKELGCTAYIPGPIGSLEDATIQFRINVSSSVEPGIHVAKLLIDYTIHCGGGLMRRVVEETIPIYIDDPVNSVELVATGWYGASPASLGVGQMMYIVFRNNEVPEMNGIVLDISLPKGIVCSIDNSSRARLTPSTIAAPPAGAPAPTTPQGIYRYITMALSAQAPQQTSARARKGDYIVFLVPLNIFVNKTGIYYANATLSFIDHWGSLIRFNATIPISVIGGTKVISVKGPKSLKFINRIANMTITLKNVGDAPIYDVYVAAIPRIPLALVTDSIKYIGMIGAGAEVNVTFKLVYNPTSIGFAGGSTTITYTSLLIVLTILYRDVLGYQHTLNTTIASPIEPFIDIRLSPDTTARYQDGVVAVTGTVVNYGTSMAHSLEISVEAGGTTSSTFIGDVDPSSQTAFRVELHVGKPVNKVNVIIRFRDVYNNEFVQKYSLPIKIIKKPAPTTTTPARLFLGMPMEHMIVIAIVAVFLAIVALIIYKFIKRYSKRLSAGEV